MNKTWAFSRKAGQAIRLIIDFKSKSVCCMKSITNKYFTDEKNYSLS